MSDVVPGKHLPTCDTQLGPEFEVEPGVVRMTIFACTGCLPRETPPKCPRCGHSPELHTSADSEHVGCAECELAVLHMGGGVICGLSRQDAIKVARAGIREATTSSEERADG